MNSVPRVNLSPGSADHVLAVVQRLYRALRTVAPDQRLALEAKIRGYSERYQSRVASSSPRVADLCPTHPDRVAAPQPEGNSGAVVRGSHTTLRRLRRTAGAGESR